MIIADTSIWIEFFRQNPDYVPVFTSLLESESIVTLEPVFAELIYGAKNNKEKNILLGYWKILPKIRLSEGFFIESAEYANLNNHQNLGIGLIDSIIIQATIQNQARLWTLDKKLIKITDEKYIY